MLEAQYWTDQEKYEVLTEKAWSRNSLFFLSSQEGKKVTFKHHLFDILTAATQVSDGIQNTKRNDLDFSILFLLYVRLKSYKHITV